MITRSIQRRASLFILVITLILSWGLSNRIGMVPPLGHFMNPWQGFWQNMESGDTKNLSLKSDMLQSRVIIRYDERGVPHIFAENDYDLYFAQGFVTARDRLWQIDFQTRAAAGRLSEIIGPAAIEYDRSQRRMGMMYGAEVNAASSDTNLVISEKLQAYADGYNAWLSQLSPRKYPVEYKIMDARPEPFTPLSSSLMLMNLSQTLTSGTRAHAQTNAKALLDDELYTLMYPFELPWVDPLVPPGQRWDFEPLEAPVPDPGFIPEIVRDLPLGPHDPGIGSNSWAVDGSKTASGYPLLASDPHLTVTLPSIWYEIQLNSNGINTYGASIPGAPGVVIGFNENIAWGITNTGSNTLDIYEIEFRDEHRNEYLHDGKWKPVVRRPEEIAVRGGQTVIDTVLYTHHGPVAQPHDEDLLHARYPQGHAIQWIAHQPGNNILQAVYRYNRAENQDEFEEAMRHFTNLTQNFIYADRDGNISAGHFGKFPVRYRGQGDYISNGRDPASDWSQFVPFEHLPRVFNPERGFVSTANQAPADHTYPYYMGRFHAGFSRGVRINEILAEADNITAGFFEEMLMDNRSLYAEKMLEFMLSKLDIHSLDASLQNPQKTFFADSRLDIHSPEASPSSPDASPSSPDASPSSPDASPSSPDASPSSDVVSSGKYAYRADNLPEFAMKVVDMLEEWDFSYHADSRIANFYKNWELSLQRRLWNPLINPFNRYLVRPDASTTFQLLLEGKHHVFPVDVAHTVRVSFFSSLQDFIEKYGDDPADWNYGRDRLMQVNHLAMLPGFGSSNLAAGGTPEAINATGSLQGPSWRMIVELGPQVRARGHFPGGQSGNPGHPGYSGMIDDWVNGRFHDLRLWRNIEDEPEKTASTLELLPR